MTKQDKFFSKTKKMFKSFCNDNRLRYKLDDCGDPISPTRKRKFTDHLYWFGSEKHFGVWVARDTKAKYNNLKKKLIALGCILVQDGDAEGTLIVSETNALKVAKTLGTQKNKISAVKRKAASDRMKKLWNSGKMARQK